jgi:hypothetical protein
MLSNGVTASNDSVTPAPKPANTVLGPDNFPSSSTSKFLYASNAKNRTPALTEFPTTAVVQPAYHSGPNLGHGAGFVPGLLLARRRFSWLRVFANSAGYVIAISMAPAVAPASRERRIVGWILGQLDAFFPAVD